MDSTINIIGAGAVGKALAVLLQNQGKDVRLIRGRTQQKSVASETITVQLLGGPRIKQSFPITTLDEHPQLDGIIVITAKSFGNAMLASQLAGKVENADIVLLQNGLGVEQPFMELAMQSLMRCVLFLTSQVSADNIVEFKAIRPSAIGWIKGKQEQVPKLVSSLDTASFPFIEEKNIQEVIWSKAIINCVFNSICPLLEIDNGIFHREKKVLQIGIEVIREGISIAQQKGVTLKEEDVVERLLQISKTSDRQLISTLQDMNAKRPTEIDSLNLAVANMGQELGRAEMVERTALLGKLVWWKSQLHR